MLSFFSFINTFILEKKFFALFLDNCQQVMCEHYSFKINGFEKKKEKKGIKF